MSKQEQLDTLLKGDGYLKMIANRGLTALLVSIALIAI